MTTQPVQAGRLGLDSTQPYCPCAARLRNKSLLELVLLVYLYQVEGATLQFWIVAFATLPAVAWKAPQTTQMVPCTASYFIGFKYVFGIIFLHPYMVGGMATAFAIWASSWVNTFPERPAVDTDDANKQRVKHERYQLKGIAHLAFCIKVITDLGQWAGADKLSTGVPTYLQWTSKAARLMMPLRLWRRLEPNGPSAVAAAQKLSSVSLLIAVISCVSAVIESIQAKYCRQSSAGKIDAQTHSDRDAVIVPRPPFRMPAVSQEQEDMLFSQKGIWIAAWSLLLFLPAELLYRPYETHAFLQRRCLSLLISAIMIKIENATQSWNEANPGSKGEALLTVVSMAALSALSTALLVVVWGFCFGVDAALDVLATNIQTACTAVYACFRMGTFAVGVPFALILGVMKNGGSVEDLFDDLFDEGSSWQTVSKWVSRSMKVVGHWVGIIACTAWAFTIQPPSKTDYDSQETTEILALIRPEMSRTQAKRAAPAIQKQRKGKQNRAAESKAFKTPLPSGVSPALHDFKPKLETEQSSPTAAGVSDVARQSGSASFSKSAVTTALLNANTSSPLCRVDVKAPASPSKLAQHSSPGRVSKPELQTSSGAESHKSVELSSPVQSCEDVATAPAVDVRPPLVPQPPVQSAAQQQDAGSKAAAKATGTAADQMAAPTATDSYCGPAAVTAHPFPAQFQDLFPSAPVRPGKSTPVPLKKQPKQNESSEQSPQMPSTLSNPVERRFNAEPRCAARKGHLSVEAADKGVKTQIFLQFQAPSTPSKAALATHDAQKAAYQSDKSGHKAARRRTTGLSDAPSISSGLAASTPLNGLLCTDQDAGSDDGDEAAKCIICWTTDRETTLAPCGHRVLCRACTLRLVAARKEGRECICPFCRTEVESYILKQFDV